MLWVIQLLMKLILMKKRSEIDQIYITKYEKTVVVFSTNGSMNIISTKSPLQIIENVNRLLIKRTAL
ncbi:unnamed protein product [Rhizophagus irregularis]|uniref:Uncharacterized protein n=1 Tax=Rhizophagus irregularis TaxID=588596 RepID=A0A915YRW2_9GLOM|nr:unnamed protein product [Rhizophagus irregularis]